MFSFIRASLVSFGLIWWKMCKAYFTWIVFLLTNWNEERCVRPVYILGWFCLMIWNLISFLWIEMEKDLLDLLLLCLFYRSLISFLWTEIKKDVLDLLYLDFLLAKIFNPIFYLWFKWKRCVRPVLLGFFYLLTHSTRASTLLRLKEKSQLFKIWWSILHSIKNLLFSFKWFNLNLLIITSLGLYLERKSNKDKVCWYI